MKRTAYGWALLLLLISPVIATAEKVSEKLIYSLTWTGIPVGTATQEILDEGELRKILSTARSNAWLSTFYKVDDRTESVLARKLPFPGESRYFRLIFKEGGRGRDREITFIPEKKTAIYRDRAGTEVTTVPIVENTYDIYSSFYFVRFLPLEVGKSHYIHVLDGKELRRIEVQVLKKEKFSKR